MGIIRAIGQAIGGTLADQWLEVIEADDMSDKTVFTSGVLIRKGQNTKGTGNTVSNGSIIHVYDNHDVSGWRQGSRLHGRTRILQSG